MVTTLSHQISKQTLERLFPETTMPVKTQKQKMEILNLLSKYNGQRLYWTCYGTDQLGFVMKRKLIAPHYNHSFRWRMDQTQFEIPMPPKPSTRNVTPKCEKPLKVLRQLGAAASRTQAGNKPQTANAGRDVFQFNWYGSDYSDGRGFASLQQDPGKFTQPLVEMAKQGAPMLMSPNVEECGYADRLVQLTLGNSSITTQEAANVLCAYGEWPEKTPCIGQADDALSEPGPTTDRFYTLDSFNWESGTKGWLFPLPGAIADLGMFGQNCAYNYLMNGGYFVHVQCNASKFHQGTLIVACVPECEFPGKQVTTQEIPSNFFQNYPLEQLTLFPHQLINLRTNNCATAILPYINAYASENAYSHNYWTVVVAVLVGLDYAVGASTVVPVTVSIAPVNASFAGLRNAVVRQGVPTTYTPGSGQLVTTIPYEGIPMYPFFEATHGLHIPGEFHNFMDVAQIDTFCTFQQTNGAYLPSFLVTAGRSPTADAAPLVSIPLRLDDGHFSTTYLARLTKFFVNYRGGLKLRLIFCGSAMCTLKLLLSYVPPGSSSAPPTRQDAMLGTHVIWDIGLQSTCDFVIPWISQTQYRFANQTTNKFGTMGWFTVWYQTALVVPPSNSPNARVLMTLSADQNFEVRMPTDSAFFQGPSPPTPPSPPHPPKGPSALTAPEPSNSPSTVDMGASNVLTAAETGASSEGGAEMQQELRNTSVTFSKLESSVENFYGKYALSHTWTFGNTNAWATLGLTFADDDSTAYSLKAKYRMATYIRCNYDLMIAFSSVNAGPMRYQITYFPPGTSPPTTLTSLRWEDPTTPTVIASTQDPPATIRIPFLSVASAYTSFYDGYPGFGTGTYGENPGNQLGTLAIRNLNYNVNINLNVRVSFFARPVNVRAWCPRPILTYKPANVTRTVTTDSDGEDDLEAPEVSSGVRIHYQLGKGKKSQPGFRYMKHSDLPAKIQKSVKKLPVFYIVGDNDHYHEFYGIPIGPRLAVIPLHYVRPKDFTTTLRYKDQPWMCPVVWKMNLLYDAALIRMPDDIWFDRPDILLQPQLPTDTETWTACCDGRAKAATQINFLETCAIEASQWAPYHIQLNTWEVNITAPPGWCGSPLFLKDGRIIGMCTAGFFCSTNFTNIGDMPWLPQHKQPTPNGTQGPASSDPWDLGLEPVCRDWGDEMEYHDMSECTEPSHFFYQDPYGDYDVFDYEFGNQQQLGQCFTPGLSTDDIRALAQANSILSKNGVAQTVKALRQLGPDDGEEEITFQGIMDCFRKMGESFGTGFTDSMATMANDISSYVVSTKDRLIAKAITTLVKAICAAVLIARAPEGEMGSTAACVGIMLGIDLAAETPFCWLKKKIQLLLGIDTTQRQGFTDMVKDFNTACTAAKGLEWIGQKISQFIDWLRSVFGEQAELKKKYYKNLKLLPQLLVSMEQLSTNLSICSQDKAKKICENLLVLKHQADMYGHPPAAVSKQLVSAANKAREILNSLDHSTRMEPIAILIRGGPGTGKSIVSTILGQYLAKKHGGFTPYSLPPDSVHMDGYNGQSVVIIDDLAQNPDGEQVKAFCQMVSTTQYIVPQAAIEDKGKLFTSPFVIATTNHTGPILPPTITFSKALERRFCFDLDIVITDDCKSLDGTPDFSKILDRCSDPTCRCTYNQNMGKNFACLNITNGSGLYFRTRGNKTKTYSLDQLATAIDEELLRRTKILNSLRLTMAGLSFQGPTKPEACPVAVISHGHEQCCGDTPLPPKRPLRARDDPRATIRIREADCVIQKIDVGVCKPTPREIVDLLQAVRAPEVIEYCEQQGWIVPPPKVDVKKEITDWLTIVEASLGIGAALLTIVGMVYLLYKMIYQQGPYSGRARRLVPVPVQRTTTVKQGPDMQFTNKLFTTSLFDVQTDAGHFTGLGLYDQWLLIPKHAEPGDELYMEGVKYKITDRVGFQTKDHPIDLLAVCIDRPVNFRNILKNIPEQKETGKDCILAINNEHYRHLVCYVGEVTQCGHKFIEDGTYGRLCSYHYPTKSGQCGGVIVECGKIYGMHVAGNGHHGFATLIDRKMFENLTWKQGQMSELRPAQKPINIPLRTKLCPSVWHDKCEGTKEPAALRQTDPRLEVDLDKTIFSKHRGMKWDDEFDQYLDLAADHYASQLKPILGDVTQKLSLEEVVYGRQNLEGLDLNTSAGFPYVTMGVRKRDLIPERGEPLTKLQEALDLHGYDLPFVTYLKDELRPIEKVKAGKTRIIECASLNDTVRMKTDFGMLFSKMHEKCGPAIGSAVGCNPDVDWSRFYVEMNFDNPIVAFDYSNYDASLHPKWFNALKRVLSHLGLGDRLYNIDSLVKRNHKFKNMEYDVEGGMPSGCSGTSIFNSMINNLIIRTLTLFCYDKISLDDLRILAYGDDVVVTYPYQLDANLLAQAASRVGLTMTPPDKSEEFRLLGPHEVTFLKRRFVPDETFPFLIHPAFDEQEVYESLRWTRSPRHTQEHVSSLCYLIWHNGEESYQKFVNVVNSDRIGRCLYIPSFSVLRYEWLKNF